MIFGHGMRLEIEVEINKTYLTLLLFGAKTFVFLQKSLLILLIECCKQQLEYAMPKQITLKIFEKKFAKV